MSKPIQSTVVFHCNEAWIVTVGLGFRGNGCVRCLCSHKIWNQGNELATRMAVESPMEHLNSGRCFRVMNSSNMLVSLPKHPSLHIANPRR